MKKALGLTGLVIFLFLMFPVGTIFGQAIKLDFNKTAHLIIDVQLDYCSPKGAFAQATGLTMEPMVAAAKRIDAFVKASRDVLKPVWIRTEEYVETIAPNLRWGALAWAAEKPLTLCKIGTPGYDYFIVKPLAGEKEIHKNHYAGFFNPELERYLRENNIDTIVYSGVLASRCVYATMVCGSALGFKSVILEDLVENPLELSSEKKEFLKVARLLFAKVVKSNDILATINIKSKISN